MNDRLSDIPRGETGIVMVVDDQAFNRRILCDLLVAGGHQVVEADTGEAALELLRESVPDTILLDVMMPGIDGYEICRRIKRDPATAHIPVLLVTALADRADRLTGIDAGANDFISKPIDARDMLLRVRNSVLTKHLFDRLQESYRTLREIEDLRDNLTTMLVHDLRSPLTGALGFIELLRMHCGPKLDQRGRFYTDQVSRSLELLNEMVSSILDVSRLEAGEMPLNRRSTGPQHLVDDAISRLGGLTEENPIRVVTGDNIPLVNCDAELIRRVLTNLLANAIRFSPAGAEIVVSLALRERNLRISVEDSGPGVPAEYRERIFEKFGQVDLRKTGRKYSSGLGLTFCKLAVEAHGGSIGVEAATHVTGDTNEGPSKYASERGATFWFTLPAISLSGSVAN